MNNILPLLRCHSCGGSFTETDGAVRCVQCQTPLTRLGEAFAFIEVPDDIVPTIRQHAKDSTHWTSWRKRNYEFYRQALATFPDDSVVLDFGVGQGQFHDLFQRFRTVVAADFYPYHDANVICDLTKKLPFADGSFDLIIASNVFEHLPDTASALRECRRVLKPGGRIIGTIPFLLEVHQAPYDFHRYTYLMLEKLLNEGGWHDVQVSSLGLPQECYLQLQRHFFYQLFDTGPRLPVKTLWAVQRILNALAAPFASRVASNKGYTSGYAFQARRP